MNLTPGSIRTVRVYFTLFDRAVCSMAPWSVLEGKDVVAASMGRIISGHVT